MLVKTSARLLTSTPKISSTALGVGPPAFIAEWLASSATTVSTIGGISLSAMAGSLLEFAPDSISEVQTFGEQAFAAALLIAICQAAVAVFHYQTNPSGQLVVPPGPTHGIAMPPCPTTSHTDEEPTATCDNNSNNNSWFRALKELESALSPKNEEDDGIISPTAKYEAIMHRLSKSMVFLLPWATNVFSFLLERNVHLFHLGFIFALAQLFDFPHRLFPVPKEQQLKAATVINAVKNPKTSTATTLPTSKAPERILVLGDSLVAGVGTVNIYEEDQKEIRSQRGDFDDGVEDTGPGPVFPRVLAQTISQRTGKPIRWRSEGVVGGDTRDIEEQCLFALREEVAKNEAPDIVVVVSGINDLKHFGSNPIKYPGPQAFRDRLKSLIDQIHEISPHSKVVLPALPTQMFRRDSPLNIFPLVGFVSAIVGFWDAQKKYVAHRYPDSRVEYIGLFPREIYEWYMDDEPSPPNNKGKFGSFDAKKSDDTIGLISADGIHPNARCYAHWGESIARKLVPSPVEEIIRDEEQPPNIPSSKSPSFVHL